MAVEPGVDGYPDEWNATLELCDPALRQRVNAEARARAHDLATGFYDELMRHPEWSRWVDQERVTRQLHASMTRWITSLFDESTPLATLIARQHQAGEAHARMGLGHDHVTRAARVLKRDLVQHWRTRRPGDADEARVTQYVYEWIDLALDAMGASASRSGTRSTRNDEAYKLHFLSQNLRTERERQKLQLLEWSHQMLFQDYWALERTGVSPEGQPRRVSPFELWIEHKASILFDHSPEVGIIRAHIRRIEDEVLPRLRASHGRHESARAIITELQGLIAEIQALTTSMFDRASGLDDDRDDVTHLLNRRYFPTIVKREIEFVQAGGAPFSILLVEVDRFEDIAHALGAPIGDLVLSQLAESLGELLQAGDFVFRFATARFLVLQVEAPIERSRVLAQDIQERLAGLSLRTPATMAPAITVSVGLAAFDGHPDYQAHLDRAELALREARAQGGNRVVVVE